MRSFEKRIEHLVEGAFARVFKSGLTPLEVAHRLTRTMDDNRSAGVSGGVVVPNHFWVYLAPDDFTRFSEVEQALTSELGGAVREHAQDEQYGFMGPVRVALVLAQDYPTGAFEVLPKFKEGPTGHPPGSLTTTSGERLQLGGSVTTVGRVADNHLVLSDPNVSRHHAEIHPVDGGYRLIDRGSTNGTLVNGVRVNDHVLAHGDLISFGSAQVRFEAS